MKQIWHLARREWREQLRQPPLVVAVVSLQALVSGLSVLAALCLDLLLRPAWLPAVQASLGPSVDASVVLQAAATTTLTAWDFLLFSQMLGLCAVQAGQALLHDRQCGTLSFLLLAPLSRGELLAGKALGAIGLPLAVYAVVGGLSAALLGALEVYADAGPLLPPDPAWLCAFLLGGPLWTAAVAVVCTLGSALARDVRAAQQGVWFLVFFATLGLGALLSGGLGMGLAFQAAVALLGGLSTLASLSAGASVLSRDLAR
jgi:ABC-type Na+ efflux pump permease subunit